MLRARAMVPRTAYAAGSLDGAEVVHAAGSRDGAEDGVCCGLARWCRGRRMLRARSMAPRTAYAAGSLDGAEDSARCGLARWRRGRSMLRARSMARKSAHARWLAAGIGPALCAIADNSCNDTGLGQDESHSKETPANVHPLPTKRHNGVD
jgi:hypothetical protein